LTARPGFGKTFALRCFAKNLDRNLHEFAYLCLSTVSITEFYRQFCGALGIDAPYGKPAMFKAIQDRLFHLLKERKKSFVLILDEANELSSGILKDLKMLMNYDYDSLNCFSIVLAGEPYLNHTLEKPVHVALRQRIAVHYSFAGLSDTETEQYLIHKLRVAGAPDSILGEGTLPALIGYAQGCPRLLDNLMTQALMLGAQLQKPTLDAEVMMAAVNSLALH
jgi:type II secretory pathway predicted ATPase ExeA